MYRKDPINGLWIVIGFVKYCLSQKNMGFFNKYEGLLSLLLPILLKVLRKEVLTIK
jgi:hypothetical protein